MAKGKGIVKSSKFVASKSIVAEMGAKKSGKKLVGKTYAGDGPSVKIATRKVTNKTVMPSVVSKAVKRFGISNLKVGNG